MRGMPPVPPVGRVHPWVWSKAVSEDDKFLQNHLSGSFGASLTGVLVIAGAIGLFILLLILID